MTQLLGLSSIFDDVGGTIKLVHGDRVILSIFKLSQIVVMMTNIQSKFQFLTVIIYCLFYKK